MNTINQTLCPYIFKHFLKYQVHLECKAYVLSFSHDMDSNQEPPAVSDCVFPFKWRNKTHYACTYDDISPAFNQKTIIQPWCSTKVDENNNHIDGPNWRFCNKNDNKCPVEENPQRPLNIGKLRLNVS